jgi:hypothetical protein
MVRVSTQEEASSCPRTNVRPDRWPNYDLAQIGYSINKRLPLLRTSFLQSSEKEAYYERNHFD